MTRGRRGERGSAAGAQQRSGHLISVIQLPHRPHACMPLTHQHLVTDLTSDWQQQPACGSMPAAPTLLLTLDPQIYLTCWATAFSPSLAPVLCSSPPYAQTLSYWYPGPIVDLLNL